MITIFMRLLLITVKEHRYQQVKCSSVSVMLTCVKKKNITILKQVIQRYTALKQYG